MMQGRILLLSILVVVPKLFFADNDDGTDPYKRDMLLKQLSDILREKEIDELFIRSEEANELEANGLEGDETVPYLKDNAGEDVLGEKEFGEENILTKGLNDKEDSFTDFAEPVAQRIKGSLESDEIRTGSITEHQDAMKKLSEDVAEIKIRLDLQDEENGYNEKRFNAINDDKAQIWDVINGIQERLSLLESADEQEGGTPVSTPSEEEEDAEPTREENVQRRISELEAALSEDIRQELARQQQNK